MPFHLGVAIFYDIPSGGGGRGGGGEGGVVCVGGGGAGCVGKALADACLTINDLQACMGTVDFTQGDREPAHEFTAIIYDDGGSKPFADWLVNGSYDAFKTATGREK